MFDKLFPGLKIGINWDATNKFKFGGPLIGKYIWGVISNIRRK